MFNQVLNMLQDDKHNNWSDNGMYKNVCVIFSEYDRDLISISVK